MNVEVELMDPEFNPDSSEDFNQSEKLDDLESSEEFIFNSESEEEYEESFEEESIEQDELVSESIVYDDTVLIEKLDMLHYDFLMIFTILVVMFARICLNSLRSLALNSYKALRR